MGRRRKFQKLNKEEIAEDWCFVCKDGGTLRICDYKNCLKAYHPECVEKDDFLLKTEKKWSCNWHFCFLCNKTPKFNCYCCPISVCGRCLDSSDFVVVRRQRGFCIECLELAINIEENKNANSNGNQLEFNTPGTEAFYFYGYWEKISKEVGLTLNHLISARKRLKKGKNYCFADSCENDGDEDFVIDSENGSQDSVSDYDDLSDTEVRNRIGKGKRSREKSSEMKRKTKSKKLEFVGWASKCLVEFLTSIGKNATVELSEHDVTSIITEYCKENNLFDAEKKRKINCDKKLQPLLGRKSVNSNSILRIIEKHFAANLSDSEDEIEIGPENKDEDSNIVLKRQKQLSSVKKCDKEDKELVPNIQKSEFASIIPQNIKLVYLRKSLVAEFAKELESFDDKVMGSFVRVKKDPNDIMQKNPFLLVKVIGIKKDLSPDSEILLQVSNMVKEVPISQLSEFDFLKEECDDLGERIKNGLLQRLTVVELEKKARSLHEDITKHWIARELVLLQNRISRANEKGWRREMAEYMDKMELLRKPSEQSRLLNEVPQVIAEIIEVKPAQEHKYAPLDSIPKINVTGLEGEERCSLFVQRK